MGEELLRFVSEKLCRDPDVVVLRSSLLFADRIIDSINVLPLIAFVEERLGRQLADDELVMPHFSSVDAIVASFFT